MGAMSRANHICLGRALTESGPSLPSWLDVLRGRHSGAIDVDLGLLERALGAPAAVAPIEPPPVDSLALGLLELEEQVLRDSYVLAATTLRAHLREWRRAVDVAALEPLRRDWHAAGLTFDIITASGAMTWSADEQHYVCRLAAALEARIISVSGVPAVSTEPAAGSPFPEVSGVRVSLVNDADTDMGSAARVAASGDFALALDLRVWTRSVHGPLMPFVETHVDRISHIRLPEDRPVTGTEPLATDDDATAADVLRAFERRTTADVVVVVASAPD